MIKRSLVIFILLVMSRGSFALVTDFGLDPLDQSSGARPYGMGDAFTAASGDLNSLFYNPAGFAGLEGMTATIKDSKNFSLGVAVGTGFGSIGAGFVYKNYTGFQHLGLRSTYDDNIGILAYALKLGSVSFGVTGKSLLTQSLAQ
jgi:hypothetical protein